MSDAEKKLQFILMATCSSNFHLDVKTGVIYLDEACRVMFDCADGALPFQTFVNCIHAEDRQAFVETISPGGPYPLNNMYDTKFRTLHKINGKNRWVQCKGKRFVDGQGITSSFYGVAKDITVEEEFADDAALTRDFANLMIEAGNIATFTSDFPDGELVSSALLSVILTGEPGAGTGGDLFIWHLHPDDTLVRIKAMESAIETGTLDYEARFVWNDSSVHWVKVHGTYAPRRPGGARVLTGVAMDVSVLRDSGLKETRDANRRLAARNEVLERLNEQLMRSNQELEQYAYVASHDLQEPLRKIAVFSDKLGKVPDLPDNHKALVSKISHSSQRMSSLILDLLEFSRLLNPDAIKCEIDLLSMVNSILSDFEITLEEKNALVTVQQLPVIRAVKLQMNQLFYNLMSNALKFANSGLAPRIDISCRTISFEEAAMYIRNPDDRRHYYEIRFRDNGIGFEAQYAEQIFEVFSRLHGRSEYPGSGIGLALCRRIVTNHGGCMYAESEPGNGTTMVVVLPG